MVKVKNISGNNLDLTTSQAKELIGLSFALSDFTDEILEENGKYQEEFITGLDKSLIESKVGKTKEIGSLSDLVTVL